MLQNFIADAVGASEPVFLAEQDTALDAAQAMLAHRARVIVVQHDGKPVGLVTERDLARRVVASRRLPQTVPLRDVMSKEMVTLCADETVEAAMDLMAEKNLRLLPLQRNGTLIGVLCINDLYAAVQQRFAQTKGGGTADIGEILPKYPLVTVPGDATVSKLATLLESRDIGGVAVMDGCALVGIVTERDVVCGLIATGKDADTTFVHEIMTDNAQSVSVKTSCEEALQQMKDGGFRHMPVMMHGAPIGMVSIRDLKSYVETSVTGSQQDLMQSA